MKKYPLIISDFDGTLFRSDYTIDERTIQTVRQFVEQGGVFVISSGRPLQSILKIAKELGLKGLVCAFNGAVIADVETGQVLYQKSFSPTETASLCKTLEEEGLYMQIYELDRYYASERTAYLEKYESVVGDKAIVCDEPMPEFVLQKGISSIKVLTMVEPSNRNALMERLEEKLGDRSTVTSGAPYLIEMCVKGVTKGAAVEFLSKYYEIPIENMVAIGDSPNDLPMLRLVGKGIAVKNADETLKKEIFTYRYSNDENAVGKIIEEYGLTREYKE